MRPTLILFTIAGCVPISQVQMLSVPAAPVERLSPVAVMQELADSLAEQLSAGGASQSNITVSVAVSVSGERDAGGVKEAMAGKLKSALFRTGRFTVIEDPQMEAVLSQYRIQDDLRAVLNNGKAPDIGTLAKAQGVVVCSLIDVGTEWAVQCRLIPLGTGAWSGAAEGRLEKSVVSAPAGRSSARQPGYLGVVYLGDNGLEVSVLAVSRSRKDNTIRLQYGFRNYGMDERCVDLIDPQQQAYIADPAGNIFPLLGAEGLNRQEVCIRPGGRAECTLIFRAPSDSTVFADFYVTWNLGGGWRGDCRNFRFRVPGSALQ